eukprot:scaffold11529_cov108-Cylindrotheca_fusiformis.AAC.3
MSRDHDSMLFEYNFYCNLQHYGKTMTIVVASLKKDGEIQKSLPLIGSKPPYETSSIRQPLPNC